MRGLKGAGIILAGIVGAAALIFLLAVYIAGLLWISKNVLYYLNIAAIVAFAACVFVLLPLALFRSARRISAYGFFVSSVIFGVATWILGFLVTFEHWGATGLIAGFLLAGVGVVPLGMLASAFHAVWPQVGDLALGLVLTFGARAIAFSLTQRIDRDEARVSSNSTPAPHRVLDLSKLAGGGFGELIDVPQSFSAQRLREESFRDLFEIIFPIANESGTWMADLHEMKFGDPVLGDSPLTLTLRLILFGIDEKGKKHVEDITEQDVVIGRISLPPGPSVLNQDDSAAMLRLELIIKQRMNSADVGTLMPSELLDGVQFPKGRWDVALV